MGDAKRRGTREERVARAVALKEAKRAKNRATEVLVVGPSRPVRANLISMLLAEGMRQNLSLHVNQKGLRLFKD